MARLLALAAILFASGCSQPQASASGDMAYDEALAAQDQIAFLSERVAQLEREAEQREADNRLMFDAAISDLSTIDNEVRRLADNERVWQEHIDYLRSFHGLPPL